MANVRHSARRRARGCPSHEVGFRLRLAMAFFLSQVPACPNIAAFETRAIAPSTPAHRTPAHRTDRCINRPRHSVVRVEWVLELHQRFIGIAEPGDIDADDVRARQPELFRTRRSRHRQAGLLSHGPCNRRAPPPAWNGRRRAAGRGAGSIARRPSPGAVSATVRVRPGVRHP